MLRLRQITLMIGVGLLLMQPRSAGSVTVAQPQNFSTVNASAFVGSTVQTLLAANTHRAYLQVHLPNGGLIALTFDGSVPAIGAPGTITLFGVAAGQVWTAPGFVPTGPINVVAYVPNGVTPVSVTLLAYPG